MENLKWINVNELKTLENIWMLKYQISNELKEKEERITYLANYDKYPDGLGFNIISSANEEIKCLENKSFNPKKYDPFIKEFNEEKESALSYYQYMLHTKPKAVIVTGIISLFCLIFAMIFALLYFKFNNDTFYIPFIALSGVTFLFFLIFITLCLKRNDDKKGYSTCIKHIRAYNYQLIINNIKEGCELTTQCETLNKQIEEVNLCLADAKKNINSIPKKYIDYVSEFDNMPAIFNFIEIIEDGRANSIKELIDTYLNDEFKKKEAIHIGNMEALMKKQQNTLLQNSLRQQKIMEDMKQSVAQRLDELKKSVDNMEVNVDVTVSNDIYVE